MAEDDPLAVGVAMCIIHISARSEGRMQLQDGFFLIVKDLIASFLNVLDGCAAIVLER